MQSTSIQPWLSVKNAISAVAFYKNAFGAIETYRLETPDGLVVKLSVKGAEFWVSGGNDNNENDNDNKRSLQQESIRMILIENDPEFVVERSLQAGAKAISPVGEEHGWKLGRIEDPFGLHWEIGHPVS